VTGSVFRSSPRDALVVVALLAQTALVVVCVAFVAPRGAAGVAATSVVFGLAVCWCSNTVSHVHLHRPIFRSRELNRGLSLWITLATGVPQSLWRRRHFWHHAGEKRPFRLRLTPALGLEVFALVSLVAWILFARRAGALGLGVGYLLAMSLCSLQGRMEHRGVPGDVGVSYYGRLYNLLCFNDGHHAEHHAYPHLHWSRLPERRRPRATASAWPPLLRGLDVVVPRLLCALERAVLATRVLERWVLEAHRRALAEIVTALPRVPARVVIVGGGLFPRSFLALRTLLPRSRFLVVDQSQGHIDAARGYLGRAAIDLGTAEFLRGTFTGAELDLGSDDLVVVPLAYEGSRGALRVLTAGAALITHDWAWRRAKVSAMVSVLLLKRVNLFLP
jgi:Fatty acid desaturase